MHVLDNPAKDKSARKTQLIDPMAVDALAIASSLGAAGMTAWLYVQRNVYKNISSLGGFDDMKPARKEHFHQIMEGVDRGMLNTEQSVKMVDKLIDQNEMEAAARLRKIGIDSFIDRWNLLRSHQKLEAVVFSVAAGSVALGSILPYLRHQYSVAPEAEKQR